MAKQTRTQKVTDSNGVTASQEIDHIGFSFNVMYRETLTIGKKEYQSTNRNVSINFSDNVQEDGKLEKVIADNPILASILPELFKKMAEDYK